MSAHFEHLLLSSDARGPWRRLNRNAGMRTALRQHCVCRAVIGCRLLLVSRRCPRLPSIAQAWNSLVPCFARPCLHAGDQLFNLLHLLAGRDPESVRLCIFFFFRGMGASTCHPLSRSSTPTRNVRSVVSPRFSEVLVVGFTGQGITCPAGSVLPMERLSALSILAHAQWKGLPLSTRLRTGLSTSFPVLSGRTSRKTW